MKKSKKLLALLMGATMLTTSLIAGGCGDPNANNPNIINYVEGATEGRPNYEDNTETFRIWSYGQTCADKYYIASEPIYFLDEYGNKVTMQTFERTEELVEAGFNICFVDYSHPSDDMWMTQEEWDACYTKQTLDYCKELGLKAFTHGSYLYGLCRAPIVDGVEETTRIQTVKAQGYIDQQAVNLRPNLLHNAKQSILAQEEIDGAIREEITDSAIEAEREAIRQEILVAVNTEADAKTDFASPEAKAEWIESETATRFAAELEKQATIDRIAAAVDTAVANEIDRLANEIVDESIDEKARDAYWQSAAEKYFRSEEEYRYFFAQNVKHLVQHENWYGYTAVDEPNYRMFPCASEAIKMFIEGVEEYWGFTPHVMLNMLPPADTPGIKDSYCEGGRNMTVFDAYEKYLEAYKTYFVDVAGLDYFQYDDYPIYNNGLRDTYLRGLQLISQFCEDNGLWGCLAMQSYGYDGTHRKNEPEDALWQAHLGAAFGNQEFSYYTYWPVLNTTDGLLEDRTHPLTRFGERTSVWYAIQEANFMLQYFGKYVINFDYVTSTFVMKPPLPTGTSCINGLQKNNDPDKPGYFGKAIIDEDYLTFRGQAGGLLVVTEMYDEEEDQLGFYVVNATDPLVDSEAKISIKFPGYNNVQIVEDGTTMNLALIDNTLKFDLGTGRGAFIMPY